MSGKLHLSIFSALILLACALLPLVHFSTAWTYAAPRSEPYAITINTAALSQTVKPVTIVEITGGGFNYNDGLNGIPYTIGDGDLVAAYPQSDTTEILVETSQCDDNEFSPPSYRIRRTFIEYDTSSISRTVAGARLIFTNTRVFSHTGNGHQIHDLEIHKGLWIATAEITPLIVASSTFRAWEATPLAGVSFNTVPNYPYPVELDISPSAIISGGVTRLLFRSSNEGIIGPRPETCEFQGATPNGIGSEFTAPALALSFASATADVYLPIIVK